MSRTDPNRDADPFQDRLLALLQRTESDPRLRAELERARREFFGSSEPTYVDPTNQAALDAAARRFAEWFLIERVSDVLALTPLAAFGDPNGVDAALADSRVGVFLVETGGAEPLLRDLDGGESLALRAPVQRLRGGDVLVGRLYPLGDDAHSVSAAAALLPASPDVAVAFQRDRRRLGLDRRLSQAELERLVFQQWAAQRFAKTGVLKDEPVPQERLEAELQQLLEAGGADQLFSATAVSAALREAGETAGQLIGAMLDQLAFDTDVDLDRAREVLHSLRVATLAREADKAPPPTEVTRTEAPKTELRPFRERPGEHLGERLARRIEEGLAGSEDVHALFADVERMLGESVDQEDGDEDADSAALEDGDLEPLLREFAWESGLSQEEEAALASLVAAQRAAPVPRLNVEYLDADDWFRWLLQVWLAAPPSQRSASTLRAFAAAERFQDWLDEVQSIDVRASLDPSRRLLVAECERLQRAGNALASGLSEGAPSTQRLLRVVERTGSHLRLESADDGRTLRCATSSDALAHLVEGDLLFVGVEGRDDDPQLATPIAVVPAAAEPLLG